MPSGIRAAASILFALILVLSFGCSSTQPKAESTAPTVVDTTPTPAPQPSVDEEYVADGGAETVVSEQAIVEDLPADLISLNARGYLDDVFFETDSYTIGEASREHIAGNASWLNQYSSVEILIEGHCDERNTREYNLALGERRANSVKDYLVFLGISPQRIRTISYGEERPFSFGHDEQSWSQNRRSHFVITAR
ncbi:MAG: peptidoglycan-associated lipoprotein Pal [Acidobacteria bacterium]|nr:peptidoglycan-associated lipoprotein Pal [Acidobacteriota bacterium]